MDGRAVSEEQFLEWTALEVTSPLRVSRADCDAILGPAANDLAVGNPLLPV